MAVMVPSLTPLRGAPASILLCLISTIIGHSKGNGGGVLWSNLVSSPVRVEGLVKGCVEGSTEVRRRLGDFLVPAVTVMA